MSGGGRLVVRTVWAAWFPYRLDMSLVSSWYQRFLVIGNESGFVISRYLLSQGGIWLRACSVFLVAFLAPWLRRLVVL